MLQQWGEADIALTDSARVPCSTKDQPTLAEKLTQLGIHLREATRWSRMTTTDAPNDEQDLALGEIRELLLQAHRVHVLQLEGQRAR